MTQKNARLRNLAFLPHIGLCLDCYGPQAPDWLSAWRFEQSTQTNAFWSWAVAWPCPVWWVTAAVPTSQRPIAIPLLVNF